MTSARRTVVGIGSTGVVVIILLSGMPAYSASTPMTGFFFDEQLHLTGLAVATIDATTDTLSGTITLADATLSVVSWHKLDYTLNNTTTWSRFVGFANTTSASLSIDLRYTSARGGVVQGIATKPNGYGAFFYVGADGSLMNEIDSVVRTPRSSYLQTTAYDLTSTVAAEIPAIAPPQNTGLPVDAPLPSCLLNCGSPSGGSSDEGAHWAGVGPRNTDTATNSNGAQLTYALSQHYRNVNYPSSYDETVLNQATGTTHVTFTAFSPDLQKESGLWNYIDGTVHLRMTVPTNNHHGDPSPFEFFTAQTIPDPTNPGQVSLSYSIGVGFAGLGFDLNLNPSYDASGAGVSASGDSAFADIDFVDNNPNDWAPNRPPTDSYSAIGMRASFGAYDGAATFYKVLGSAVVDYSRGFCIPFPPGQWFCFGNAYEISQGPAMIEYSQEAAHDWSWNAYGNVPAVSSEFDVNVGDRGLATTTNPSLSQRSTYFSTGSTIYAYIHLSDLCFVQDNDLWWAQPAVYFATWVYYWSGSSWKSLGMYPYFLSEPVVRVATPGVNYCWTDANGGGRDLNFKLNLPSDPPRTQYRVYTVMYATNPSFNGATAAFGREPISVMDFNLY